MPGSRRIPSRIQTTPSPGNIGSKSLKSDPADDREFTPPAILASIKHAHIPDIPVDGNLKFEALLFFYCFIAMSIQYVNLYKTVWWLPHSHSNYTLNFYLIDPYLVIFLLLVSSRRLVWCLIKEMYVPKSQRGFVFWFIQLYKLIIVLFMGLVFLWTTYNVVLQHSLLYSLFLCYPLVPYMMLFGLTLQPLFNKRLVWPMSMEKGSPKHKAAKEDLIQHVCTMSPEAIRDEVELLKTDFNQRIKQVLFNSMLCAYYTGFIPLCFAQNTLYYDTWWVGQFVCLVWLTSLMLFMVHFLPPRYTDILHRCALHLGRWIKVEGRHAHVPYNAWSELQIWQQGALVKHVRGLFKADGINNSAEPGNGMHARFYLLFHRPLRVINWLLVIGSGLVLYQFFLLIESTEWSHILSMALQLFCSYYILFKLMRDRMILARTYRDDHIKTTVET